MGIVLHSIFFFWTCALTELSSLRILSVHSRRYLGLVCRQMWKISETGDRRKIYASSPERLNKLLTFFSQ